MITLERYDFMQEYDLTPLISAFVSAHDNILNFSFHLRKIYT
jgi:hypothetical protein